MLKQENGVLSFMKSTKLSKLAFNMG